MSLLFRGLFRLLLTPMRGIHCLLLNTSRRLYNLSMTRFFGVSRGGYLPMFLFRLTRYDMRLLILFIPRQSDLNRYLIQRFGERFLRQRGGPPPNLTTRYRVTPNFVRMDLRTTVLGKPLSYGGVNGNFSRRVLYLISVTRRTISMGNRHITVPLRRRLDNDLISNRVLPMNYFI